MINHIGGADLLRAGVQERAAAVRLPHLRLALCQGELLPMFARWRGWRRQSQPAAAPWLREKGAAGGEGGEELRTRGQAGPPSGQGEVVVGRWCSEVPALVPSGTAQWSQSDPVVPTWSQSDPLVPSWPSVQWQRLCQLRRLCARNCHWKRWVRKICRNFANFCDTSSTVSKVRELKL